MHIRPRYSLLAFLLFTAAAAGGVKLCRGPHHVVDRSNPQMDDEYTYYRDWDGTKIVDGVRVRRYITDPKFEYAYFDYYRNGERLPMLFWITSESQEATLADRIIPRIIPGLLSDEDEKLRAAMVQFMGEVKLKGSYPRIRLLDK